MEWDVVYIRLTMPIKDISNKDNLELFYSKLNIKKIKNDDKKQSIIKNANNVYHNTSSSVSIDILNLNDKTYIYIKNHNVIFTEDPKMKYDISSILIVAIAILLLLSFLYFMLSQKLKPLKLLNNNINQFKQGNFIVYDNINSQDEIGKISENFNKAIENIKYLIESKNLFMRNIMHELKTPITKGIFLANMLKEKEKNEIIENFYNMDNILKKLVNIDKYQAQFSSLVLEKIDIKLLIQDIKKSLHTDNITTHYKQEINLIANKELFLVVLKNIIDNGLKYSINNEVIVYIYSNKISIKSKGDKLNKELKYYTQAFTQKSKNIKGFGLGLYIVSQILELHKFDFKYEYEDGFNSFDLYI